MLKVVELDPVASVQREILLVKVRTDLQNRSHVLETVQLFRAKVVDVASDALTIEVTGNRDKLNAFLEVLEPFGIKEPAVGHGGHRARVPVDHRPGAALGLSPRPHTTNHRRRNQPKEWPTWPRCSTTTTQT